MTRILIIAYLMIFAPTGLAAQPKGSFCNCGSRDIIEMITLNDNEQFELKTLMHFHAYQEVIQKGTVQMGNPIHFIVTEQFVNDNGSSKPDPTVVHDFFGNVSKQDLWVFQETFKKSHCNKYRHRIRQWNKQLNKRVD